MRPVKSAVSYFRQQLKIKGKSPHSGRGFYDMEFDCSMDEVEKRIDAMVARHPERYIVTQSENKVKCVRLKPALIAGKHKDYATLSAVGWALVVWM